MIMKLRENMRQSLECQEYSPSHNPWSFISNFKIKSKEIVFIFPPVFYHGNGSSILSWEWFQDKLQTYCCLWLVIYLKMTHHMTKHDSWHSWWRHLENNYWWILLGCTEVSLMLYWSIPYDMLSFPFLVWVRMTFACIIPVMFLSEFELAPNC